jgi:hypothetical protein
MMIIKVYTLIALILILSLLPVRAQAEDESALSREYQVKAAFLYNFIKFVEWPKEKLADSNDTITIGIIGSNILGEAFETAETKRIKDKKLTIKQFPIFEEYKTRAKDKTKFKEEYKAEYEDALKKCHIVFISSSEEKYLEEILNLVKNGNVLTVGETEPFLDKGGVINFVTEQKKVRFEINLTAANRAKLKIRSQLLRLSKRVVEETSSKEAKD